MALPVGHSASVSQPGPLFTNELRRNLRGQAPTTVEDLGSQLPDLGGAGFAKIVWIFWGWSRYLEHYDHIISAAH